MGIQKRALLALAGGSIVIMTLIACDSRPSRVATGEEIAAAVTNAEAQMAHARAERSCPPCQAAVTAGEGPF